MHVLNHSHSLSLSRSLSLYIYIFLYIYKFKSTILCFGIIMYFIVVNLSALCVKIITCCFVILIMFSLHLFVFVFYFLFDLFMLMELQSLEKINVKFKREQKITKTSTLTEGTEENVYKKDNRLYKKD